MRTNELVKLFIQEVSGHSIMNIITHLTRFHRIQGSKDFLNAAEYIQSILDKKGLKTIIHEYPADGKWEKWGWIAPISWNISHGECWLTKPVKKRICNFQDIPMSVITHSKPIELEAQLIDIGKGDKPEDYKKAEGKIAMVTEGPRRVFPFAAKNNVQGLIYYPDPERAANIGDNAIQYGGFWPVADNLSEVTAGFSVSHKQARELKNYINTGKEVFVHFKIDSDFNIDKGKLHVLEAEITGKEFPNEEIVLISHLCHPAPGANDNASGSATLTELAIKMTKMIKTEKLPYPRRTLRFLWVPEFSGTIPWLGEYVEQQKTKNRKILAVLNLDMVGESPEKIGAVLKINSPSIKTPSYLRSLIKYSCECTTNQTNEKDTNGRVYQLNFVITQFAGGSDHLIFNDSFFSIPSVMFGHEDPYHHCSVDNLDKIDPLECRSVGVIAGSVAYGIAVASNHFLKELILNQFSEGIDEAIKYEIGLNKKTGLTKTQKLKQTRLVENIILKGLKSSQKIDRENILSEDLIHFSRIIKSHFSRIQNHLNVNETDHIETKIEKVFIRRNYEGPTPIKRMMNPDRHDIKQKKFLRMTKKDYGAIALEFLNLANGNFSIEETFLLLEVQFPEITEEDVLFLVKLFHEEGLITVTDGTILSPNIDY